MTVRPLLKPFPPNPIALTLKLPDFRGDCRDELGIQLRHLVGVENLLWGSDYPHAESTFPRSREILERIFQGVSDDEKVMIAGLNTADLYHFDLSKATHLCGARAASPNEDEAWPERV